jgi:hypothetical protein
MAASLLFQLIYIATNSLCFKSAYRLLHYVSQMA